MAIKKYILLISVLFLIGCQTGFTFNYFIGEDQIDGTVHLNDVLIGSTVDGSLHMESITPGTMRIEGTHRNRPYKFEYELTSEDLTTTTFHIALPSDYFDYYELLFTANDLPINGDVTINNKAVGTTFNGKIRLPIEEVFPGLLTFKGTYVNKPFSFDFQIPRTYLDSNTLSFAVPMGTLEKILFTVDDLNERTIALLILEKVNEQRDADHDLKRNIPIEVVADDYAVTLESAGFHHTDDEGKGVGDRLKDEEIFYTIAGENLYFATNLNDVDEEDIAQLAMDGWLSSPGHRSLVKDRDGLFTDAGIGVHCTEKTCYIVFNAAGMEEIVDRELGENTCSLISLYDESFPFNYDTTIRIDVEATRDLNIYLVDDSDAIDDCVQREDINAIKEWIDKDKVVDERRIEKGYHLLLETTSDTALAGSIRYNR